MKLNKDHFNKRENNHLYIQYQYCDYCSYRFKEKEIYYIADSYYKENLNICERCYKSL